MPTPTFMNLPEEKRQRVVEAAICEFGANTYHLASVSKLVRRAGIAKGSFYQYFADKLDLYTYLLELAAQDKLEVISAAVESLGDEADFIEVLRAAMQAGVEFATSRPGLTAVGLNLLKESDSEVVAAVMSRLGARRRDVLGEWFARAQRQGQIDAGIDPGVAVHMVTVLLESLNRMLVAGMPMADAVQYMNRMLCILEHGLRPRPEHRRLGDDSGTPRPDSGGRAGGAGES